MVLIGLILLLQGDPAALVAKLRAENIEERDAAYVALKRLGKPALAALEAVAADDPAAPLALRLRKVIPVQEGLPAGLRARLPGLAEKVADSPDAWFDALGAATYDPLFRWEDLDYLAVQVARANATSDFLGQTLVHFRLEAAWAEMSNALSDPDAATRAGAALTLGERQSTSDAPALERLLADREATVRAAAVRALRRSGGPSALAPLLSCLEDPDGDVRWEAACALAELGSARALPELAEHVPKGGYAGQRSLEAIRDAKLDGAGPALLRVLPQVDTVQEREAVVLTLARIDARPELRALLGHSDRYARAAAALALADLGDREAIPALRRLDGRAAAVALCRLGEKDALPAALKDLESPDVDRRVEAIRHYAAAGLTDALPRLRELLQSPVAAVAAAAREAVDTLVPPPPPPPPPEDPGPFRAQLEDPALRRAAMEKLGWLGDRMSIPAIAKHLEDPSRDVRRSAALGLCLLGAKQGAAVLLEERANLTVLNALRSPAAWGRLCRTKIASRGPLTSPDSVRHDLLRWAEGGGLRIQWAAGSRGEFMLWRVERELPSTGGAVEGPGAAGSVASFMDDGRFGAIVEDDRIRIVPYAEARAFWRAWLRANP